MAHPCGAQLTAVKTGFPLTSIICPYHGFVLEIEAIFGTR